MKHLRLILTAGAVTISLLSAQESWCAPVTPDEALSKAAGFYNSGNFGVKMAAPKSSEFEVVYTVEKNGRNCFYVINHDNGYTIVSADDRLPEVLGFSDNGRFDYDKIPVNMKWWLSNYENEIDEYLSKDPKTPVMTDKRVSFVDRKEIKPMLKSKWNQDEPYNLLCPYDNRFGGISVTGCVATAMAQVMRYHEWPKKPTGANGDYVFNQTYEWDKMLDEYEEFKYDDEEADAVAQLMRDCGASVNMQYSAYESGAYNEQVQVALREYFGYNPSLKFAWRDYHDMNEWNNLVYSELEQKRPVYYSGRSVRGGHAFVCDGYLSANFFHFNWGWGGYQDGYFLLNALNPSSGGAGSYEGGYNIDQCILLGVKPANGETDLQMTMNTLGGFAYNESDRNFIAIDDPDGYNMFYNPLYYTVVGTLGIKVTDVNDPENVQYFRSGQRVNVDWLYGVASINTTPSGLKDGVYRITPAFNTEYGKWNDIGVSRSLQYYVTLVVEDGEYKYSNDGVPEPTLICSLPKSSAKIYGDAVQAFSVTVSNVSDVDFNGVLSFSYSDANSAFGNAVSLDKTVTIAANSSMDVEFVGDKAIKAGTYSGFINVNYEEKFILESYSINVENYGFEQPEKDNSLKVTNISPNFFNSDSKSMALSMVISNHGRLDLTEKMIVRLFAQDNDTPVVDFKTDTYRIPSNVQATLRIPGIEANLQPGTYYWQIFSERGTPLSAPYTMIVTGGPYKYNGVYYYVTSEKDKTAIIVPPTYKEYENPTYLPSELNGYKVTAMRGDALTFAETVPNLTLPSTVSVIEPGTFYKATGLNSVKFTSEVPPALYPNAFDPELIGNVVLNCPHGFANTYANETEFQNMKLSSWNINIDSDELKLLTNLQIDPLINAAYSPYYVSGDESLVLAFDAPDTRALEYVIEYADGEKETLYSWREIDLPALWGRAATVTVTSCDGASVKDIENNIPTGDVFSIDGYVVKYNVSKSELNDLPKGVYIHLGKKVIVK